MFICRTKLLNSEMFYGLSHWGPPITIIFVQFCQSMYVFLSKFRFAETLLYRQVKKKLKRKGEKARTTWAVTTFLYIRITSIGLKRGWELIVLDTA